MGAIDAAAVRDRVDFDIPLRSLKGDHSSMSSLSFKGVKLGDHQDWVSELCAALAINTTCTKLDLSDASLSDEALQKFAIALSTGSGSALSVLDLRSNPISLAGETMMQGLRKMRPSLQILLGEGEVAGNDGFVHDKLLVEGLTAWPTYTLATGTNGCDLLCPKIISGSDEPLILKKGFAGANGTKYTCEHAEFQVTHQTGNLVLVRLEEQAKIRLSDVLANASSGQGVLV